MPMPMSCPVLDEDFDELPVLPDCQADEPDEQDWQFLATSRWGDKRVNANY